MDPPADILRPLPEEPFGSKLRRARELAGFTLEEAAQRVSAYWPVSGATLSRIENLSDVGRPEDAQRRTIASIAVLVYRVLPSDVGVDLGDVPSNTLAELRAGNMAQTCLEGEAPGEQLVLVDNDAVAVRFDFHYGATVTDLASRRAS